MDKRDILIAGAGIAGLVAARFLQREGLPVGIIEARDRIGGRILSFREGGTTLEAGPEFIHGHLKETISLLKEFKIPFTEVTGKGYQARSGHFEIHSDREAYWDVLINKMKELKTDQPFMQFLLVNFGGEAYRSLRQQAIRFAEGFDLADVNTVSTLSLMREWELEESTQFRIPDGYGQIADALSAEFILSGGKIFMNRQINRLNWSANEVSVTTTGHHKFLAKKIIITLPVGVLNHLQNGDYSVLFSPEIPVKRAALQQIGYGTVIKIVMRWKRAFWQQLIPDAQFIFSDEDIPTWWIRSQDHAEVLTGWVGGTMADDLSELPEKELLKMAVENLSAVFSLPVSELNNMLLYAKSFNWKKEPFTRGAYSFSMAGCEKARATWKTPLEKTLYFAGEACYEGPHVGTVEAAITSGLETAREVLKDYKNAG